MDYTKEQLTRIWLQCAPLGARRRLDALKAEYGGPESLWDGFGARMSDALGENYAYMADSKKDLCAVHLKNLNRARAHAVFRGTGEYPALLDMIPDAPDVLFVRGTLPADDKTVGIVGSRRATRYGLSQTRRIAGELAAADVTVISGLARGIDTAAHLGAMDAGGRTVGVIGCGIALVYPPENKELAERMVETGGAVVSELAPDAPPLPYHFPVRNRILSGLSKGLLLIEAQMKSGTHSTVNHALSQGRDVFALPGNVDAPGSELPLQLLKDGAFLCTCGRDITEVLKIEDPGTAEQLSMFETDSDDPILKALALEEKSMDELIAETGLDAQELAVQLSMLELLGKIERRPGNAYAVVR